MPHLFPLVLTTPAFNSASFYLLVLKANAPLLTGTQRGLDWGKQRGFLHMQLLMRAG